MIMKWYATRRVNSLYVGVINSTVSIAKGIFNYLKTGLHGRLYLKTAQLSYKSNDIQGHNNYKQHSFKNCKTHLKNNTNITYLLAILL